MPNYSEIKTRLIINKLSREKYNYLLENDLINKNELYLVEDANLDALSARLLNVGDPVSATDGANKQYVDTITSSFISSISGKADTSAIQITDKYTDSTWTITPSVYDDMVIKIVEYDNNQYYPEVGALGQYGDIIQPTTSGDTETLTWIGSETWSGDVNLVATRQILKFIGYQLGSQSDKLLTPASHLTDYNNPHHVTKSQVITFGGIVTSDIASGAVTEAKLAKFTEWEVFGRTPSPGYHFVVEPSPGPQGYVEFCLYSVENGSSELPPAPDATTDLYPVNPPATNISWNSIGATATRHPLATKKTSDLENDGEDGTSPFVTKATAEAGWWSEWTVVRNGVNVTSQVAQFDGFYDSAFNPPEWTWLVWKSEIADDHGDEYVESISGSENDAVVSWTSSTGASYVATRHRVCAPVPTNPEDIGAADATSVSARFDTVESLIDELSGSRTAVYIRVYDD